MDIGKFFTNSSAKIRSQANTDTKKGTAAFAAVPRSDFRNNVSHPEQLSSPGKSCSESHEQHDITC